jgi:hypothetical protein
MKVLSRLHQGSITTAVSRLYHISIEILLRLDKAFIKALLRPLFKVLTPRGAAGRAERARKDRLMLTQHSSSFETRNAQEEEKEENEEEERRRRRRLRVVQVAEEMSAARVRARHELNHLSGERGQGMKSCNNSWLNNQLKIILLTREDDSQVTRNVFKCQVRHSEALFKLY